MTIAPPPPAPPHCPNPDCRFHRRVNALWKFVRIGFYTRQTSPRKIQRYRCDSCRRKFSDQTFSAGYWLRRPDLLVPVFHRLVGCSGFRQIAREQGVSPTTIGRMSARLGRHCLLFHVETRPQGTLAEPLTLDGFESFEWSQFYPTSYHVAVGQDSHYFYGFTESECRRRGSMTPGQRRRRADLERRLGKPDPRSIEKEVGHLLSIVAPRPQALELHTDSHKAYPRALRRAGHLQVDHHPISSRAARTVRNPLFAVNLLDLLLRHSGSNHKRETIAASKRRASAIERMWLFLVWRNWVKSFSERFPGWSPAMQLGLAQRRLSPEEILAHRRFPCRIEVPLRWQTYYWRTTTTRTIPRCSRHDLKYAA